jgi:hypothetical protein
MTLAQKSLRRTSGGLRRKSVGCGRRARRPKIPLRQNCGARGAMAEIDFGGFVAIIPEN